MDTTPMDERVDSLSPLKRAILELRQMRSRLEEIEQARTEPVAVIGMGLRFPGNANTPDAFWQLLREGLDTVTEIPAERWDVDAYYDADPGRPGKMTTRYGAFLEGVDLFDAPFFGISPREAVSMDPQQRLLLEVAWEALENAAQAPEQLAGSRTGVYIGISNGDYFRYMLADPAMIDTYHSTGNIFSVAAGRISYLLGLHGPSLSIDTACSSSLSAVHLACQGLRGGECRMALVGGVNLILSPEIHINFSKAQMMARDGRCKTFDVRADGYVRGEGCAVIVLKRLCDAQADGDRILALLRGTAINHDGRSTGLTVPNGPAQEAVIREALAAARVKPAEVGYIETHGTGTSLGDPIEVRALGSALAQGHSKDRPFYIGSVKTNIGHLEAASGLAGLIKVILALQHDEIPPHLHFQTPNPYIDWDQLPVVVPTRRTAWPAGRRIAGVSSFGFSGTNVHAILEEAPASGVVEQQIEPPWHLLCLSAKTRRALETIAERFSTYLGAQPDGSYADTCFTTNTGRSHFAHRLAVVAQTAEQARNRLTAFTSGQLPGGVLSGQAPGSNPTGVVFLFTGHGSQYVAMGRQLYETQPTFRHALEQCDQLLRPSLGGSLIAVLYSDEGDAAVDGRLGHMGYAQPALFALEYALATLWKSWGIEPAAVMGHSMGEYVAACIAGVFSVEDGLRLVSSRGQLMQQLPKSGEMVTVFADVATVVPIIAPYTTEASIAAINGPETVVISGSREGVHQVVAALQEKGIKSRRLPISQASHSPLVEPMLDAFEQIAAEVVYSEPQLDLVSGMTGKFVNASEVTTATYWRRHLREPVHFAQVMSTLYAHGYRSFVEVGPNPTLLSLGQRCVPTDESVVWLPSLRQGRDDWQQMLESLGTLYVRGAAVDWAGFEKDYAEGRRKLALPTYPWEHKSYWWNVDGQKLQQKSQRQVNVDQFDPEPTTGARIWDTIVAVGHRQAEQAPLDLNLHTYSAKWRCLERLTAAYVGRTFQALGAFTQPGESHFVETLLSQFGMMPVYRNLIERWLRKLAAQGWLQAQPDGAFVALQPLQAAEEMAGTIAREARDVFADALPLLDYVQHCGDKLTAVLTGVESPLETLFPSGSFAITDYLYHDWAVARYFNNMLRAVLESFVQAMPNEKPLRVLEIGAGTGGTASFLIPVLPPHHTHYDFTDVSDLFLGRAQEKFGACPFVNYGHLDIEQDPQPQGYPRSQFDVIVAANVLHATKNVEETARHIRGLLAPHGLLLLYEATDHMSWFDVTTGLIEGWQRFDDDVRASQDHPLLTSMQWDQVLRAAGFEAVTAFPDSGSPVEVLGQHVIVAQVSKAAIHAPQGPFDVFRGQDSGELRAEEATPDQAGGDWAGGGSVANQVAGGASAQTDEVLMRQLCEALPGERKDLLVNFVRGHVTSVLRLDPADPLDRSHRLMDLGVDSLMAVELRNRLGVGLGLPHPLPATLIFDYPTVDAIAEYLMQDVLAFADQVTGVDELPVPPDGTGEPSALSPAERLMSAHIEQLSDAEAEALLIQRLRSLTDQG